jgi:5-methyltetrahydropteroyltriglutamate--homocysteine methyltransferase
VTLTTTTYRIDQIGSLVRPAKLLDVRDDFQASRINLEQLRQVEDDAMLALRMQQQIGLDVYSDGEMSRDAWQTNFSQLSRGLRVTTPCARWSWRTEPGRNWSCTAKPSSASCER